MTFINENSLKTLLSTILLSILLFGPRLTLAQNINVSTATFVQEKDIFSDMSDPTGMTFNPDGTKLFLCGGNEIITFDLSTAYDVSTAVRNMDQTLALSEGTDPISPTDIKFKQDGDAVFVVGSYLNLNTFETDQKVYSFGLSSSFDLSNVVSTNQVSVGLDEDFTSGIELNNDGTKFFIVGKTGDQVIEYNMSTAYDVSTASKGSVFSVAGQSDRPESLRFNNDGTIMLILDTDNANSSVNIFDYSLTTAFDISTASYSGGTRDLSINFNDIKPAAMTLNAAGSKLHVAGLNLSGAPVWEYNLVTDETPPTVSITTATNPTNTSPISIAITFSEEVSGFEVDDITVANGSAGNLQSSNNITFTADITPVEEGTVAVDIAAGVAADAAANSNEAATQLSIGFDQTRPEVHFLEIPEYVNTNNPFNITFIFGAEDAVGFEIADINVVNAIASNLQSTSTTVFGVVVEQFTVDITPDGSGNNITINIPENIAQDPAANNNIASETKEIVFDDSLPIPTISTTAADPTNLESIPVTITFNEQVTGFTSSAIAVTNGTIGDLQETTAKLVFTTTLAPTEDGEVQIDIFANSATDNAGNGNASHSFFIIYDNSDPVPVITVGNELTNTSPIPITIDFGEEVDFESTDLSLAGATAGTATSADNITFTVELTPEPAGVDSVQITINLEAAKVADLAGNENQATEMKSIIYDTKPPVPTLTTLAGFGTESHFHNGSSFTALVSLNEVVENFVSDDISVNGGTISNFGVTLLSPRLYSFDVTPTVDDDLTISVASDAMNDGAGNQNVEGDMLEVVYDGTAPTITSMVITEGEVTNKNEIHVVISFSEVVSGFLLEDLEVTNGSASLISSTDDQIYTATISTAASTEGEVSITVKDASVEDLAGNALDGSESASIIYDTTAPTLDIQNIPTAINSANPFSITLQFSESIAMLSESNIEVTNGSNNLEETDSDTYLLEVTPSGNGDITLTVSNYHDLAGNTGTNVEKTVFFDNEAPTVEIENAPETITTKETFTITITFSEEVTGFEAGDITVVNCSASNVTSGTNVGEFTADITPDATIVGDDVLTISIPANAAEDIAGNGNTESTAVNITFKQKYSGGSGTDTDPYLIGSEADLRALSANHEDWDNKHFRQIANIKMSDEPFLSIGREEIAFNGTYDGGQHIISHLNLAESVIFFGSHTLPGKYAFGFIGYSQSASIINLGLVDVYQGTHSNSIALYRTVGLVAFIDGNASLSFEKVFINYRSGAVATTFFGGLVGYAPTENFSLTISNSYVTGEVRVSNPNGGFASGSIIGVIEANVTINNSYSSVSTQTNHSLVNEGGLIGSVAEDASISINNSFWDNELHTASDAIGDGGTGNEGGEGRTSAEMRPLFLANSVYTNSGWDFAKESANGNEDIWTHKFSSYPILTWQLDNLEPFTISGKVVDENGVAFSQGSVKSSSGSTVRLGEDGSFSLDLPAEESFVSVTPDSEDYYATYHGNTNNVFRATLVLHDQSGIEIQMIAKSQTNQLDGNGRVSGRVVEAANGSGGRIVQGRILEGDPLEGVTVFLVRTSDEEILTSVVTDANGDFEITGIPEGEYQLLLDVAGIDLNLEGSTFTMDQEGSDLTISAAVSEEGVVFEIAKVLGLEDEIEVMVYPNPVSEFLNVRLKGVATVQILNQSGQLIYQKSFANETILDVRHLFDGVYFIELINNQGRAVRKLIKNN